MRLILSTLFISISSLLFAQITIEQQVISSFFVNGNGSIILSSTGGQVENTTSEYSNGYISQGFEQGNLKKLGISFSILSPECNNGDPYQVEIQLDSVCTDGLGQIILEGFEENEVILIDEPGSYSLTINCDNGSNHSDTIVIPDVVLPGCNLEFYNVITPAHELSYWHIENIESEGFKENKVTIFNRWGAILWEGENYDNQEVAWFGMDQDGTILPQATYYYAVEVNQEVFTGFIELVR